MSSTALLSPQSLVEWSSDRSHLDRDEMADACAAARIAPHNRCCGDMVVLDQDA